MSLGLALTGLIAWLVSHSPAALELVVGNAQLADDTQRVLAATFPDSPYVTGRARAGTDKPWWQIW